MSLKAAVNESNNTSEIWTVLSITTDETWNNISTTKSIQQLLFKTSHIAKKYLSCNLISTSA